MCDEEDYAPYVLTRTRELKYLDHRLPARGCGEGQGPVRGRARRARGEGGGGRGVRETQSGGEVGAGRQSARGQLARRRRSLRRHAEQRSRVFEAPKLPSEKDGGALTKGLLVFRETFERLLEEFTRAMERQLAAKNEETSEWRSVLDGALAEKDAEARALMRRLETERKHAFRALEKDEQTYGHPEDPDLEHAEETRAATREENEANAKRVKATLEARRSRSRAGARGGAPPGRTTRAREARRMTRRRPSPSPESDGDVRPRAGARVGRGSLPVGVGD